MQVDKLTVKDGCSGASRFPCHICLAEVDSKHSFALFSSSSLKEDWPRRASELLQLSVTDEEGLPRHLCKNCKAKVLSVEEKLQKIRTQAQHTLRLLEEKRSVRKRAKDTSSGIVSPHTVAVRPVCHIKAVRVLPYKCFCRHFVYQQTRRSPFDDLGE